MMSGKTFIAVLQRDVLLSYRQLTDLINPLLFFMLFVIIFPLALSPDIKLLHDNAPGLIWMSITLAMLLNLDQLFKTDYEDGSLNLMLNCSAPLSIIVLAKVIVYWFVNALPLVLLAPLVGLFFHLTAHEQIALFTSLLLGTPIFSLMGALGAALTIGLRNSNLLLSFLLLPLYVPVLIFGAGAVSNAANDLPFNGQLALLAAILLLGITALPFAIAAALKMCNE